MMTIGQCLVSAANDSGVGAIEIGSWTMNATETVRRWMNDKTRISGEDLELLRIKLPTLPGYLAKRIELLQSAA